MNSGKNLAAIAFAVVALLILGGVVWSMMPGKGEHVSDEDWQTQLKEQLHEIKFPKPEKEFDAEEYMEQADAKLKKMVKKGEIDAEVAKAKMEALRQEIEAKRQDGWIK
jgi:uncharacterized protein HemX